MLPLGSLPTIENLQCFLAAAEHLNFRRAAATIALTPTAFGQRIRQLEEQLGCALFERTTRQVRLTTAGSALVPQARTAIEESRRCLDAVHDEAPPVSFVVGSRFELAQSWVAPSLSELSTVRPNWKVHIYCGSGRDIIERLKAGDVDCIITSAPMARSGWTVEVLYPETYVFVGAPKLLGELPLDLPEHCADHTLLDVDPTLPLTRYLTAAEGPPLAFGDSRHLGSGGAMHQLILSAQGVGVLPEYMVSADLAAGRLVRLLPDRVLLNDTFRLIYRSRAPLSRTFAELADFLRSRPLQ